MRNAIIAVTAAIALGACSEQFGASLDREVGGQLGPDFGNATMNNMLVQTGQRDYTVSLARRFAEEVDTTVNFAFDSAQLSAQARATLARQASWIRQFPEIRFAVYGHTDLVGSEEYNRRLGLRRAQVVVAYLASQGVDPSRLEALVSYGETQPLIVTEGRERRNRRTVTEVSGFVQSHPSVLNGKYAQIVFREYVASAQSAPTLGGEGGLEE